MFLYLIALTASNTQLGRSKQVGPGVSFVYIHAYLCCYYFEHVYIVNSAVLTHACCIFFGSNKEKRKPWWWATCDPFFADVHLCRLAYNNSWCELFWIGWPVTDSICPSSMSQGWEETPCLTSMPNLHCSPWLQRTGTPRDLWCN